MPANKPEPTSVPSSAPGTTEPVHVNPSLNPAGTGPLNPGANAIPNQNRKVAEILDKIQSRLNDITNVKRTMQSGAYEAFGNNFITRGAMSLGGMVGDLLTTDDREDTPEERLVKLAEEHRDMLKAVLIENKKQTVVFTDFSSDLNQKMLGHGGSGFYDSRGTIDTVDYVDQPDNPAIFNDVADRLQGKTKSPYADDNPNVFSQMGQELGKGLVGEDIPKETSVKVSVDEIIPAERIPVKRKLDDVTDVDVKKEFKSESSIPALDKLWSEPPKDVPEPVKPVIKPASVFGAFVPESPEINDIPETPNSFSSMASTLGDKKILSDSDKIDEASSKDAEEDKTKDRFFKSVVGLLTKIDKGIDKQNHDKELSNQESTLEAGQNGLIGKFKDMLKSAVSEMTSQTAPITEQLPESPSASDPGIVDIDVPDIDIDIDKNGNKVPSKKTPGKAGKLGAGLGKVLRASASALKVAGPIGLAASVGMGAYDAYNGWNDAASTLGIEGREATFGEKLASSAGGAIEGMSFGLIDKESAAKWLAPSNDPKNLSPAQRQLLEKNVAPKDVLSDRPLTLNDDKVATLNTASDALRRIENQQRASEKTEVSGAPVQVNTNNTTTNQSIFGSRRSPNNTEISFNRYISGAMAA